MLNSNVSECKRLFDLERVTYGVDIRIWIFGLAMPCQDFRCKLVQLTDQLEQWIVWKMAKSEFSLSEISGVRFSQDGMAIAW